LPSGIFPSITPQYPREGRLSTSSGFIPGVTCAHDILIHTWFI
jgi:hypothetical protein